MFEHAAGVRCVVIACGFVDYPRAIITREEYKYISATMNNH